MDARTKEQIAQFRDTSPEAIRRRLKAALRTSGRQQTEIAQALGVPLQTINSQIAAGSPKTALMAYFYENFRIDFNFLIYGDVLQLPVAVQDTLLATLAAEEPAGSKPSN